MDVGKWRALVFFASFNDDDNDKNNSNTKISDKVVIGLAFQVLVPIRFART